MYVGKRSKSIFAVLLIIGLLVVSVPCRAYGIGPVALGPALKYAIGAGLVSGGLYAANKDALNYAINDYWTKASDHVKQQWQSAVIYGTGVGIILLNDPLKKSINDYLDSEYTAGGNEVIYENIVEGYVSGDHYQKIYFNNGMALECVPNYFAGSGFIVTLGGNLIYQSQTSLEVQDYYFVFGTGSFSTLELRLRWVGHQSYYKWDNLPGIIKTLFGDLVVTGSVIGTGLYEFVGDTAGFGNATEGRPDIKVPCPPVPAAEWPDQWLDDLQDEMNRTGNPTLDDETSIEEWEEEWEWYIDENGNIYKVKKGQSPKKPDDEPIRIPGPPLPAPDVPENYPTEDDPDLTIEHHPPQTTITENPDGSRTETTTQTTTTTRKWWDPSSQRWRTTTTDTTTTTTVDFAPDGTETGRTTTTTTQPKGEREETPTKDDTAIDWEPLKRGLYELTEKFPFCLPWDLMRGIQSLESSQWDRQIRIDVGDGIWPAMVIDLSMFDNIASITRVILLIVFDLGLIFGTRKLMGGDV